MEICFRNHRGCLWSALHFQCHGPGNQSRWHGLPSGPNHPLLPRTRLPPHHHQYVRQPFASYGNAVPVALFNWKTSSRSHDAHDIFVAAPLDDPLFWTSQWIRQRWSPCRCSYFLRTSDRRGRHQRL